MSYRSYGPTYSPPRGTPEEEAADLAALREKVVKKPSGPPYTFVMLLSGGLDSAVTLADILAHGHECVLALNLDYGQTLRPELAAAQAVAEFYKVPYVRKFMPQIVGSAITTAGTHLIRTNATAEERAKGLPATYVPMRNLILLAYAGAYAYVYNADGVAIGIHEQDAPYPDCSYDFVIQMTRSMSTACGRDMKVFAPFLLRNKAGIVQDGAALGVPFGLTYSCYQGTLPHCGVCDACLNRTQAFLEANVKDPTPYMEDEGATRTV